MSLLNSRLLKAIEYLFYLMILLYLVGKSFEVLTIIIDIIFIFYLIRNKESLVDYIDRYREVFYSFLLLLLYFLIQSLFTNNPLVSLSHSFGMVRFIILLFAVLYVFNTKEKIINVILVSFIALFIVNIDSLYQYIFKVDIFGVEMYGNGRRINAWNEMPVVSLYSGEFFGILLSSVIILKDNYRKVAIFSLLFFVVIFFLSGNRSPIVSLFSTIFIIGLFSSYKKYLFLFLLAISFVFSLTFFSDKLSNAYKDILSPSSNEAINGRTQIYVTSLEIIKENPLFGIGSGMFRYDFQDYYSRIYDKNSEDKMTQYYFKEAPFHSHNILLDLLVSYGFVGFLIFIFLVYKIYLIFVKGKDIVLIASVGFVYCITPLQFAKSLSQSNWQFYTFLGLIFMILISVYLDIEKKEKNEI